MPSEAPRPAAANAQTTPEQEAVIAAVVRFSVGYSAWIWEKKCQALTADQRREFDEVAEVAPHVVESVRVWPAVSSAESLLLIVW